MIRKRHIPHATGQYASSLYIEVSEEDDIHDTLCRLADCVSHVPGVEILMPPHLSLTKLLMLHGHVIHDLPDILDRELSWFPQFSINLGAIQILENEDASRFFLAATVDSASWYPLVRIVDRVNSVCESFDLPQYYTRPIFHFSFASSDSRRSLEAAMPYMGHISSDLDDGMDVHSLKFKVGNKVHTIQLRAR